MTPAVHGFSLADKIWRMYTISSTDLSCLLLNMLIFTVEFSAEQISDIEWDDSSFENLVLPQDRKTFLRSLVEAHKNEVGVDDFVRGKGRGLVINLFGMMRLANLSVNPLM